MTGLCSTSTQLSLVCPTQLHSSERLNEKLKYTQAIRAYGSTDNGSIWDPVLWKHWLDYPTPSHLKTTKSATLLISFDTDEKRSTERRPMTTWKKIWVFLVVHWFQIPRLILAFLRFPCLISCPDMRLMSFNDACKRNFLMRALYFHVSVVHH